MKTTVIEVPAELKPAIEKLVTVCERALGRAEQNRRLDALGLEAELREAARECEGVDGDLIPLMRPAPEIEGLRGSGQRLGTTERRAAGCALS